MAIISKMSRYEGPTVRLTGFAGNKYILDNTALDGDLISINKTFVDIPGNAQELVAGSSFSNVRATKVKGYTDYRNNSIPKELLDISSENSAFGGYQWSDPVDENENYIMTRVKFDSTNGVRLSKLDKNGNIILSVNTTFLSGGIIDSDDKYIYILGQSTDFYYYLYCYNRATLVNEWYLSTECYVNASHQVIGRDSQFIHFVNGFNIKTTPLYFDKTNATSRAFVPYNKRRPDLIDLDVGTYSASGLANYSLPMKNQYCYVPCVKSEMFTKEMKWQALFVDTNNLVYDTVSKDEMQITWAAGISEDLKTLTQLDTSYIYGNRFLTYKIDDNLMLMFQTTASQTNTTVGSQVRPRWYVLQTDDTDPKILKVLNAGEFKYAYLDTPICYDKDKFIFIQEDIASHMYKLNKDNNDLVLTWNINTPNICSAAYYNGIYWWLNYATNELNYETETNTLTIVDSFEFDNVSLENTDNPGTNTYKISVYNSEKKRVAKNLKLECQGAITFDNDLKTKQITTSVDDDISLTIKVVNGGNNFIKATIVE